MVVRSRVTNLFDIIVWACAPRRSAEQLKLRKVRAGFIDLGSGIGPIWITKGNSFRFLGKRALYCFPYVFFINIQKTSALASPKTENKNMFFIVNHCQCGCLNYRICFLLLANPTTSESNTSCYSEKGLSKYIWCTHNFKISLWIGSGLYMLTNLSHFILIIHMR